MYLKTAITHRQDSALQMQAISMADLPIRHKMFLNRELQLLKAVWQLLQQLQVQQHLRILSKLLHRQATTLYRQKQFTAVLITILNIHFHSLV